MMVVLFIMAIVLALTVGVSRYVMEESGRSQTITTQDLLMEAVHKYREETGDWPDGDGGDNSGQTLLTDLKAQESCKEILNSLPQEALGAGDDAVKDGFDKAMRYDKDGGRGNRPVVISAGANGDFNDEEDNIRSDDY
jgi:hypothetical protein